MTGLAIIAGSGDLPGLLADECNRAGRPYRIVRFEATAEDASTITARFEKLGMMFDDIKSANCTSVVFAGRVDRPVLDPQALDAKTLEILPKLMPKLNAGDADTLSVVSEIFEEEGFHIEAPHEVLGELLAPAGNLTQTGPSSADFRDIARAAEIVAALGAVDVGQAAVVAQGLCLGVESLQGTDAMLGFVADGKEMRPDNHGARGVLYKAPKPDQDLRMDMPALGPQSVRNAARAGLAGIAYPAGSVLILERRETVALADELGLFLYGLS